MNGCGGFFYCIKLRLFVCACKTTQIRARWASWIFCFIEFLIALLSALVALFPAESYVDAGGRSNVRRLLVRAVVPLSHDANGLSPRKTRSFVIKALAAALRKGYFVEIAELEF